MLVFLSYQTEDRHIAAEVSRFFNDLQIETFMAHENIEVSHEWQDTIMDKLDEADIFVAILTERYLLSEYCIQESGIAVFLEAETTIVPLRVDKTLPPGFMKHIQARPYTPGQDNDATLFSGIAKCDVRYGIDLLTDKLARARSFAQADKWFGLFWPYQKDATPNQKLEILQAAAGNFQFAAAHGCREGLLQLYEKHGYRLNDGNQAYLERHLR